MYPTAVSVRQQETESDDGGVGVGGASCRQGRREAGRSEASLMLSFRGLERQANLAKNFSHQQKTPCRGPRDSLPSFPCSFGSNSGV